MLNIRFSSSAQFLVYLIVIIKVCYLSGATNRNSQPVASLREFFEDLVRHYNASSLPTYDEVLRVIDRIGGTEPKDIKNALPAIVTALAHPDDNVKKDAAFALVIISNRADSAELLKDYIKDMNGMFDLSDERLQAIPSIIYLNLKPAPSEVTPLLVTFLRRTDRAPQAQAGAVFTLVRLASENPKVAAAVEEFLARPLTNDTRIGVLNALGDGSVKDARLVALVTTHLENPDQGVRLTAIQALMRIGVDALRQAEPVLQRIALDSAQPAEVSAEAREALKQIHPPRK